MAAELAPARELRGQLNPPRLTVHQPPRLLQPLPQRLLQRRNGRLQLRLLPQRQRMKLMLRSRLHTLRSPSWRNLLQFPSARRRRP
jgi:hypothetical protein